jgi:DNA-binding NarL/FixJ family response regulator
MCTRVVLVDDHEMFRGGLRSVLAHALELCGAVPFDVVVMDVGMPGLNGIDATQQIVSANPTVKVIALSAHADQQYVLQMLDAGAAGYVLKISAASELVRAISAVMRDENYLSTQITGILVENYLKRRSVSGRSALEPLAPREREVLQLLAEGHNSTKIAERFGISRKTVETHRRNIMRKLNVHTVAQLTKLAIREGLTQLEE